MFYCNTANLGRMGELCTRLKLLTDLQILGCELHIKCVWRPGSARPRWASYSDFPDPVAVKNGRRGRKGKERVANREGAKGEGRE